MATGFLKILINEIANRRAVDDRGENVVRLGRKKMSEV